jgi:hypothetical protein
MFASKRIYPTSGWAKSAHLCGDAAAASSSYKPINIESSKISFRYSVEGAIYMLIMLKSSQGLKLKHQSFYKGLVSVFLNPNL